MFCHSEKVSPTFQGLHVHCDVMSLTQDLMNIFMRCVSIAELHGNPAGLSDDSLHLGIERIPFCGKMNQPNR